jgi:hypothetical protein
MADDSPTVFINYAHEDKELARAFATALEARGLKVWIDENELLAGDSIIERIASAVAGVDFFCAFVSEASRQSNWCRKELSLAISGELGREGAQVMPLRVGDTEMPESLVDVLWVHLDPGDVGAAADRIAADVARHRQRRESVGDKAATQGETPAGRRSSPSDRPTTVSAMTEAADDFEPIEIVGVVKEGVGKPRNDGTRGSGLYRIPLRLSRRPSSTWADLFRQTWDRPPLSTTMHRPGIGAVEGDTIVLDGTTMDELERYHLRTLRLVLEQVNRNTADIERRQAEEKARQERLEREHDRDVDAVASRLRFD